MKFYTWFSLWVNSQIRQAKAWGDTVDAAERYGWFWPADRCCGDEDE